MAEILNWEINLKKFGGDADVHDLNRLKDDVHTLNTEACGFWKRVKSLEGSLANKADHADVKHFTKVVKEIADQNSRALEKLNQRVITLPNSLRDEITQVLQKLCAEQLAAIDRLCAEKHSLLQQLEKQSQAHAAASKCHRDESAQIAVQSVENIRRELAALRAYAEKAEAESARHLQRAAEVHQQTIERMREGQAELDQKLSAAKASQAAAEVSARLAAETTTTCATFWGRLRWLFVGVQHQ